MRNTKERKSNLMGLIGLGNNNVESLMTKIDTVT